MKNKRGQGMSTNTIILLILGVVILVVLILGFTMGWSKFAFWLSSDNVQEIKTQCSIACSTGNDYGFCSKERTLKTDDGDFPEVTCDILSADVEEGAEDIYGKYGIEKCSTLTCPSE